MTFLRNISRADWQRPSVFVLLIANLAPIFGVLVFHWTVFPLIFLFWFENLIIGVFNVLRMIFAMFFATRVLPGIPFFFVHYGIFLAGHLVLIIELFGGGIQQYPILADPFLNFSWRGAGTLLWQIIHQNQLEWAALGLAVSRGFSFVTNYLGQGEYRRITAAQLFWQPYGRLVVLHVSLLGGAALIQASHSPAAGLILLVVLKTLLDLAGHLWERKKMVAPSF